MRLLRYDFQGVLLPQSGLSSRALQRLGPCLEQARQEVLEDLSLCRQLTFRNQPFPPDKDPLDAEFLDLPERLLEGFRQDPDRSQLGRIRQAGDRLAEAVDRVVLLGIGGSYMGARALLEALCHPYHNELGRSQRRDRPRIYFEGNNLDNSTVAELRQMLAGDDRWAILVISKSGKTLETAVALRVFLAELQRSCARAGQPLQRRLLAVTGRHSPLWNLVAAVTGQQGPEPAPNLFDYPANVGGRFSVLSAVGLLPAAVLGLDLVGLLEGAAAMNQCFRTAPPGDNPVLDYAGVCHLMEAHRGATIRVLATWGKRLEALGLWYDQLLSESLGKHQHGATPITVVNTRDLHSRGQQHQEGRRDKLITNVIAEPPDPKDRIAVGRIGPDHDGLDVIADRTLPEVLEAAYQGTSQAYREEGRPTAEIRLPALEAPWLGQLFQMLMLATVVEGYLLGINPYGQPGVQKYKARMNQILGIE